MDLAAIRAGLAAQLLNVDGLRSSAEAVSNPTPPMAIVQPASGTFLTQDYNDKAPTTLLLTVTLVVSRASDRVAQSVLDDFISAAWGCITDQTLGGTCDYAGFTETRNYGTIGDNAEYVGAELLCEIGL